MKILYSKKKRKYELFRCISNFLIFLMVLYYDMDNLFFLLLFFCLSLLSFYLFIKTKHYLIIEDNIIKQNYIFGKKMNLAKIKTIKHFAGEYILRTEKRKMTITIDVIDKSSLLDLTTELKKLDVKWI
jgi:hypothetical protein